MSHFGAKPCGVCSLHGLIICNGMANWPSLGGITYKTYNGHSMVDYVLCSQTTISRLLEFNVGACPIELKSDHMPLLVRLDIQNKRLH